MQDLLARVNCFDGETLIPYVGIFRSYVFDDDLIYGVLNPTKDYFFDKWKFYKKNGSFLILGLNDGLQLNFLKIGPKQSDQPEIYTLSHTVGRFEGKWARMDSHTQDLIEGSQGNIALPKLAQTIKCKDLESALEALIDIDPELIKSYLNPSLIKYISRNCKGKANLEYRMLPDCD